MDTFFFIVIAILGWLGAWLAIVTDSVPTAIIAALMIYITRPSEYR